MVRLQVARRWGAGVHRGRHTAARSSPSDRAALCPGSASVRVTAPAGPKQGAGDGGRPRRGGTARSAPLGCRHPHLGDFSAAPAGSADVVRDLRVQVGPRSARPASPGHEFGPENEMERLSSVVREFFRPRAHGVPDERRSWSSTTRIRMRCSLLRVVDGPGLRRRRRKRSLRSPRRFPPTFAMRPRESVIKKIFYRPAGRCDFPEYGSDAVTANVPGRPRGCRPAWCTDRQRACRHHASSPAT
jgi:hypothetical protein